MDLLTSQQQWNTHCVIRYLTLEHMWSHSGHTTVQYLYLFYRFSLYYNAPKTNHGSKLTQQTDLEKAAEALVDR